MIQYGETKNISATFGVLPMVKFCKSTNGIVGTIFTNGNQKTLNVFLLPMVPLVPLVDHMVEFLSY